ncbi:MAG: phage terminase large subunit [Candidatus Cloacimonetes bacterium]|nr:phage terminase large subunit [Candidatus Cloacimonadota bacterium]
MTAKTQVSARNYDKLIEDLVSKIKLEAKPFTKCDPLSIARRSSRALDDYEFFAKTYFPHHITRPFGAWHREIIDATQIPKTITAIAGPRAHGKTIIVADTRPIWLMLRGNIKFYVAACADELLATERTGSIAAELAHNERLLMDFGPQLPSVWADSDFITRRGCRFLARGYKQTIRGLTHGSYRPDYIVVDDLENHLATNPRIAQEKKDFVREECFGALPLENDRGVVIWLGNLTHADSALAYFKKDCEDDPDNPFLRFILAKAILEDGTPLWPEGYTIQDLENIKRAMGTIGFERHFMMNPITEGIKFKSDWFAYYETLPDSFDYIVTYCDPSLSSKKTADYKAIITLGMANGKYYLLDAWIRRASINAMLLRLYELDKLYHTRIFMESVLWQKVLWEFIPPLSESQGYLLPVSGVENRIAKDQRIEAITPIFEWGWLLFPKTKSKDLSILQEQLLAFPQHPNDDGPDALAGALDCLKNHSYPMEYRAIKSKARFRL